MENFESIRFHCDFFSKRITPVHSSNSQTIWNTETLLSCHANVSVPVKLLIKDVIPLRCEFESVLKSNPKKVVWHVMLLHLILCIIIILIPVHFHLQYMTHNSYKPL